MFITVFPYYTVIPFYSLPLLEVATFNREGTLVCGTLYTDSVFFSHSIGVQNYVSLVRWEVSIFRPIRVRRPLSDCTRQASAGVALLRLGTHSKPNGHYMPSALQPGRSPLTFISQTGSVYKTLLLSNTTHAAGYKNPKGSFIEGRRSQTPPVVPFFA